MKLTEKLPGKLIVVEGADGSGKTTVCKLLVEEIKNLFPEKKVQYCRLPDGPVRDCIMNVKMPAKAEVLMFIAGHLIEFENKIKPALQRGEIVVLDRFYISTLVYQGCVRGESELTTMLVEELVPEAEDAMIYVETDFEIALERLRNRKELNRFDLEEEQFHQKIHQYMKIAIGMYASENSLKSYLIKNNSDEEDLQKSVRGLVSVLHHCGRLF